MGTGLVSGEYTHGVKEGIFFFFLRWEMQPYSNGDLHFNKIPG